MEPIDPQPIEKKKKKKKKKKPEQVFVEVGYPKWLGFLSFGWALVGWFLATATPHLALSGIVGILNFVAPTISFLFILTNLYFAFRDLRRGVHALRLFIITCLQIALFTTLFYQLFKHVGASLYELQEPTSALNWVGFSLAHAFRASDALDLVEAYNLKIQTITHASSIVAILVILYHVVVDVFFLGMVFAVVARIRDRFLEDEWIRNMARIVALYAFGFWFLTWFAYAAFITPWRVRDIPLWYVENVLRVVDFADIMESFHIRLHSLPREGVTGTLTFFCRFWIAIALASIFNMGGSKKKQVTRAVVLAPDQSASRFWMQQFGLIASMILLFVGVSFLSRLVLGDPVASLVKSTEAGDSSSRAALKGLAKMGPDAESAIEPLMMIQLNSTDLDLRKQIVETLGYLGPKAVKPLVQLARETEDLAVAATKSLGELGTDGASGLVQVWSTTSQAEVQKIAEAELIELGSDGVGELMKVVTLENSEAIYRFLPQMDPNWQIRSTSNPVMLQLQELPQLLEDLKTQNSRNPDYELYRKLGICGSAANICTPVLLEQLFTGSMRNEAIVALQTIGKSATPAILQEHAQRPNLGGALERLLGDAKMWDLSLAKTPSGLKVLQELVVKNYALVPLLGEVGPAAKSSVPDIVPMLASTNEGSRTIALKSLQVIDPNWKKNPNLSRAIPRVLLSVDSLPETEKQDLIQLLGPIQAKDAEELVRKIIEASPRELDQKDRLVPIVAGLKTFGTNLSEAVPAFVKALEIKEYNPFTYYTRKALIATLPEIAKDCTPYVPLILENLDDNWDVLTKTMEKAKPEALLPLFQKVKDSGKQEVKLKLLDILQKQGAKAKSIQPQLMQLLSGEAFSFNAANFQEKPFFLQIAEVLDGISPDWQSAKEVPTIAGVLISKLSTEYISGMLTPSAKDFRSQLFNRLKQFQNQHPNLAKSVAVQLMADNKLSLALRPILLQLDANWTRDPKLTEFALLQLQQFQGKNPDDLRSIITLGPILIPELKKLFAKGNPKNCGAILLILKTWGKDAQVMIPDLVQRLNIDVFYAEPDYSRTHILQTLEKMDPEWQKHPDLPKLMPNLVQDAVEDPSRNTALAINMGSALGEPSLPLWLPYLKAKEASHQRSAIAGIIGIGPKAKSAVPQLLPLAKHSDPSVKTFALDALCRLLKDDPKLVPTISPFFLENGGVNAIQLATFLDRDTFNWRFDPGMKPIFDKCFKDLKAKELPPRQAALRILNVMGGIHGIPEQARAMNKDGLDYDSHMIRQRLETYKPIEKK